MEVDTRHSTILAPPGTVPSVQVELHPLVLMNISEHWTRTRAQKGAPTAVFGALIGKQTGRSLEVLNSFELVTNTIDGNIEVNRSYYDTKSEQFKQVFPELELFGWYTTGGPPTEADIHVHQQICQLNESPILVKLDPSMSHHSESLPVKCYESIIDIVNGDTVMLFVELKYSLATEEAERIGVDHVARVSSVESSSLVLEDTAVAQHLSVQHSAIKMLVSRIQIIISYLEAVGRGELPVDHRILRECNSVCHRIPILSTPSFKDKFFNQCNDVELLSYLGIITKGCQAMNQFVTKFNTLHDRVGPGSSRRIRGLFS